MKIISIDEYKKLGTGKEFWENYDAKYGKKSFVEMMVPLFSLDKKTVIIEYSNITGSRGGFGEIVILKKENNTWEHKGKVEIRKIIDNDNFPCIFGKKASKNNRIRQKSQLQYRRIAYICLLDLL